MLGFIQKFREFQKDGAHVLNAATVPAQAAAVDVPAHPKVAFEAFPVGVPGGQMVKMRYPTRPRYKRVEPEAVVFVLFYPHFLKAVRCIELYGTMKAQYGEQIPMPSVDYEYTTRCYDDVLETAAKEAVAFLYAVRNPVEVPEIDESKLGLPSAVEHTGLVPAHSAASPSHSPVSNSTGAPHPMLVQEGEYQACGQIPYEDPVTKKKGKPSFGVILRQGSVEKKLWGSDLERAIRDAGVKSGDNVRLTKYPKVRVSVPTAHGGQRVVHKNIWTCERLGASSI